VYHSADDEAPIDRYGLDRAMAMKICFVSPQIAMALDFQVAQVLSRNLIVSAPLVPSSDFY
jgi:hypothetical protein